MEKLITKPIKVEPQPRHFNRLNVGSAWKGLENYIPSLIEQLNISPNHALEFGVDHGYSTHILSQLFDTVTGVDSFEGDEHIIHEQGEEFYEKVKTRFENTNVTIYKSSFEEFIKLNEHLKCDLIHIDIVHLYEPTFECTEWSIQHSDVVILHDTISFPDVYKVCKDIADKHNLNFYNIPNHFGLGVLYR
jgi:hypothetical protein